MTKILILEDNQERIDAFTEVLSRFADLELHVRRDAHSFIGQVDGLLEGTALISLDHDLVSDGDTDPGDGLMVAEYLGNKTPVCPVIIHSTNVDRSWSMLRELNDGQWNVERHPPVGMGVEWIYRNWSKTVEEKLNR